MGGVNNAQDYIQTMGLGYVDSQNGMRGPVEPLDLFLSTKSSADLSTEPVITNSLLQGGIVSVYYLGTLVGCLLGGAIGDRVGRIKTIGFGAAWAVFGASLQCSAQNKNWMLLGMS